MNKELIALSKLLNPKEDIYSQALYCFAKELNKGITLSWKNKSKESQSLMFPQDFLKLDWDFKKTKADQKSIAFRVLKNPFKSVGIRVVVPIAFACQK